MELNDLVRLPMMAVPLIVPFGVIYLILDALNWNKKKNLFADSWSLFLTGLVSSFCISMLYLRFGNLDLYEFVFLLFIANSGAFAGILYLRSPTEKSFLSDSRDKGQRGNFNVGKLWRTSFIVSFFTLLSIISIIVALSAAEDNPRTIRGKPDNISFGIY